MADAKAGIKDFDQDVTGLLFHVEHHFACTGHQVRGIFNNVGQRSDRPGTVNPDWMN
jgi:hypothetical protein